MKVIPLRQVTHKSRSNLIDYLPRTQKGESLNFFELPDVQDDEALNWGGGGCGQRTSDVFGGSQSLLYIKIKKIGFNTSAIYRADCNETPRKPKKKKSKRTKQDD